ncbi:hypothetical protein DFH29DRAFT_894624 [Suillus ampliporus]|nr:hypothetical protein DFH29DRAFT_894624 [Suillus ampliporus]
MSSNNGNAFGYSRSPSPSSAFSTVILVLEMLKIVALASFYVLTIMAGLAFEIYGCLGNSSILEDSFSKAVPSSATGTEVPVPYRFQPSSSCPAILEASLDSPGLIPEPRLQWSISCSVICPKLHQAPIGPRHHVHALFSDAWNENAGLLKQLTHVQDALDLAHDDIDELVVENMTLSNNMDRLTRDLEIEQVRRDEADSMCRDATAKMGSQRSTLSTLQCANTALRFEIANLRAERDELIAESKESSELQKEHQEEVEALQSTLIRTKKELEGAKRELKKLKRAAAGIPELKIISPDGKVIPHGNVSSTTDSLSEDQSIAMRERLTLAYTEVVGLRDQCIDLRRRADENTELQDDIKQLLVQRSALWNQVEAANSACHKLEEENRKYFRQYVEMRAELTKVEKRTGIAISVIQEEEEEPEVVPPAILKVPLAARSCTSVFEDDSDDESIASSASCYSMASTDDFDCKLLLASGILVVNCLCSVATFRGRYSAYISPVLTAFSSALSSPFSLFHDALMGSVFQLRMHRFCIRRCAGLTSRECDFRVPQYPPAYRCHSSSIRSSSRSRHTHRSSLLAVRCCSSRGSSPEAEVRSRSGRCDAEDTS